MKRFILDYASKNSTLVTLHFCHLAVKNHKLYAGNITLEDLLKLQEDI